MGFCGCSLYASTVTAIVFGIIYSIGGSVWTGIFYFKPDWKLTGLNDSIATKHLETVYIGMLAIPLIDEVARYFLIALFVFHILWCVSSFLLILGNMKKIKWILGVWVYVTASVLVLDTAATSLFVYRSVQCVLNVDDFNWGKLFDPNQICFLCYALFAILSHKGFFIIFSILISLTIYVSQRAKEIKTKRNTKVKDQKAHQGYNGVSRPQYAEYSGPAHNNYGPPSGVSGHHQYTEYSGQARQTYFPPPEYFPPEYEANQDMNFTYPSMRRSVYDQSQVAPYKIQPSRSPHMNRSQMHAERQPSPIPYRNKPYEYGMNRDPDPDYDVIERDPNRRGMQHRY